MQHHAAYLAHADELPAESFDWGRLTWLCSARLSPGAEQTVGLCHIQPGQRNPLHYHPNCEEVLYLLAGSGRHRLGDETVELRAGSVLRVPAGVPHCLENTGTEPIVCLIAFSTGERQTVFLE